MKTYPVLNKDEPAVSQPSVNGFGISWNPDDDRWYVELPDGTAAATFKERRNALRYAKTHTLKQVE